MINEAILRELAAKWKHDAKPPQVCDGISDAALGSALSKGVRLGLEKCSDDLLKIIELLGGQHD